MKAPNFWRTTTKPPSGASALGHSNEKNANTGDVDALAVLLAVVGGAMGLYGWAVFGMAFDHDGLIGPRYNAPGADYMVYWSAARAAMAGNFTLLVDPVAFTGQINKEFYVWLSGPLPLFPWMYPPQFLALLFPFAIFPFALSYAAFQIVSFAAAAAACLLWAGPQRRRAVWLVGLFVAPAMTVNVIAGQNALLTLALMLAGVGLLDRRSFVAGAILGLLSYKPQLALMAPVALIAAQQWRALGAAAVSASLLAALSMLLYGLTPWQDWFNQTLPSALIGGASDPAWSQAGRLWGLSAWACAALLGAPGWLASSVQIAAILLAAACTWVAFREPFSLDRRMAVLLAATLAAAPHSSSYDLVLLAGAALLLYQNLLDGAEVWPSPTLLLLPWYVPFLTVPRASVLGFGAPVVIFGFLLLLMSQRRSSSRTDA